MTAAVSEVPVVGPILGPLVSIFWPREGDREARDELGRWVRREIEAQRLEILEADSQGIETLITDAAVIGFQIEAKTTVDRDDQVNVLDGFRDWVKDLVEEARPLPVSSPLDPARSSEMRPAIRPIRTFRTENAPKPMALVPAVRTESVFRPRASG